MALRHLLERTTVLDRVIVVVLLSASLGGLFLAGNRPPGARVVVEREGRVLFTSPLTAERTVSLEGPLGTTVMEMHGGKVRVLSSPCPNKVCLGMGSIARAGEIVACVPNRLLIRVEGEGAADTGEGHDLLSR